MAAETDVHEIPTRREMIQGGSTILGGGLLAGCISDGGDPTPADATDTATNSPTPTDSPTSYEVAIEPAGRHTFEEVPETYASIPGAWMDIAMGFGIQPKAVAAFDRLPLKYYDALPGVDFDADAVRTLGESAESKYDKEVFYDVDADVHLMDSRMLKKYSGWDDEDLEEIESNVGPILGSLIRFPFGGRDPYYTLYEAFEKAAQIFQRQAQYEAWVTLKESFYADIESRVPVSGGDAPTVAAFNFGFDPESGKFFAANIDAPRNDTRSFRMLGVNNAFQGEEYVPFKPVGTGKLLDVDPDYIGMIGYLSYIDDTQLQKVVETAQDHDVLSQLRAVENGNFVRTGGQYMGPIIDLFSTEALAKQLYPDEYGEWPGSIHDVPEEEQLFDRQRVADIINGNV
ncbi:ABC transporter substrate-binding protein [Halogeometricum borinquense]|uniref:ABC transporter substrate-binding protein n=1 Tax=Halogeometricum borinquense TaxID=60847 RepID=A0A6C0UIT9_9EURY|nr:ABC transporter substrate-binding protein [Halogeometricum borinquense]QIB74503.1 ABC transporter substrate-binding protein [Halogeometricum borinquense]